VNSELLQFHHYGFITTTPLKLIFALCFLILLRNRQIPTLLLLLIFQLASIWWTNINKSKRVAKWNLLCYQEPPLLWLTSYLSDSTHTIITCDSRTIWVAVYLGVPRHSSSWGTFKAECSHWGQGERAEI